MIAEVHGEFATGDIATANVLAAPVWRKTPTG